MKFANLFSCFFSRCLGLLSLFGLLCCALYRYEEHHKLTTLECGLLIESGYLRANLCKLHHNLFTEILVSHFSTLETKCYTNLVTLVKELDGTVCHCVEVMLVDTAGKMNFLDNNNLLLLLLLLLSLMLLVTVLTVIHCAAYGRSSLRCDTNKVYALFVRILFCLIEALDTELIAVLIEETDFLCADIVIDKKLFSAYSEAPPKSLIGNKKVRNNTPHKTPLFGETFCIKPMLALAAR